MNPGNNKEAAFPAASFNQLSAFFIVCQLVFICPSDRRA